MIFKYQSHKNVLFIFTIKRKLHVEIIKSEPMLAKMNCYYNFIILHYTLAKFFVLKNVYDTVHWWHIPSIPALKRQRQTDLCEFKSNLVYRTSSRTIISG